MAKETDEMKTFKSAAEKAEADCAAWRDKYIASQENLAARLFALVESMLVKPTAQPPQTPKTLENVFRATHTTADGTHVGLPPRPKKGVSNGQQSTPSKS